MTPEEYEQLKSQLPPVPGATPAAPDPNALSTPADPSALVSPAAPLVSQVSAPDPAAIPSTAGISTPGQANGAALGQLLGGNPKAGLATAQTAQEMKALPLEPKALAPIGSKPGSALGGLPGAGGPMIDAGAIAPRPGGPNKALLAGMAADQKKIDDARLATEASTNETQDELRKAGQSSEDNALNKQAVTQQAVDAGSAIQSQQDTFRQQTIARQDALDAERKAKLEKFYAAGIDPKKYWNDKSAGDKVMTGIGVALGAIGAGLAKTENSAGKMFESAINRDVESQRENLEKQSKGIAALGDMQKEGLSRAQWVDQQLSQKKQMGFEVAQKQVASYAAMSDSAEMKAKAQQTIGMLEQQKQGVRAQDAANHLAALQKSALAAGAPSADQVALQKARATQLNTMIEKRAANGEKPLTNVEMQNLLAGRGEVAGAGAVPGLVGGFSPGGNAPDKKGDAKADASDLAFTQNLGGSLKSNRVTENPIGYLGRGLSDTSGTKAEEARQAWKANVYAEGKKMGLVSPRNPDAADEILAPYIPTENDSQAAIDRKTKAFYELKARNVATGASRLPAGAKEDD